MLQKIRDRLSGKFAMAILAILLVPFAFFGVTDYNFLTAGWAARVDDSEISLFQLENAYQNQILQLSEYGELPAEYLTSIRRGVLESLIRDRLVELHAARSGYRVDDGLVTEIIRNASQFQEDGVFKRELYYEWLDRTAQDARAFEAQQRQAIRISQLQRGIGATAFVTPSEYRRYLNLMGEQRQVSIATFDVAALADSMVVAEEDIVDYYEARPDGFVAPETVDFAYIELRRDLLTQDIEITEEALLQYYEESSGRYRQDEQRRASHILITFDGDEEAAEEQATALSARAQAGEPFADLAQQYSKDSGTAGQGGDLGPILHSQMQDALGDAIFSMERGEIMGPVRTDFGFHVVKLDEIIEGGPLPLDEVRGELERELKTRAADDRFVELERSLADALFDADDLEAMAVTTGLEVAQATGFTRSGGEPFGASQAVIDAVFDNAVLLDGQISDVVEIDRNRSVVIQVTDYHPEARRSLEEVRDEIRFNLQSELALDLVRERGQQFMAAVQEGKAFAAAAAEFGAQAISNVMVERQDENVDPAVVREIFSTKKPEPGNVRLEETMSSTGDFVVFLLSNVVPGRPEAIPLADRDARKEQLQTNFGAADFTAFVNELELRSDIERSEDALQQDMFQ